MCHSYEPETFQLVMKSRSDQKVAKMIVELKPYIRESKKGGLSFALKTVIVSK